MDEEVERWIDELKIVTPSGRLPVQALSGGNQQKVVIAKWIETEPKILILNSPTVGVDVGSKADIHAYARKLAEWVSLLFQMTSPRCFRTAIGYLL